jgi:hypothetical protein
MQTEKRKNKQDDDDQTDQIDYSVHDRPPGRDKGRIHSHNSSAIPKFLPCPRFIVEIAALRQYAASIDGTKIL